MNPQLLKIGALMLVVFLAGMFVRGEMAQRAELKRQLDELKAEQKATMDQVKNMNAAYLGNRKELLDQTLALYKELDGILAAKSTNSKQIKDLDNKLDQQQRKIEVELGVLKDMLADGF
jgi:small-conductance mechanosensitive channel